MDLYSIEPSIMFKTLEQLLPCIYCRKSYVEFVAKLGLPKKSLAVTWLYTVHNLVNKKLFEQKVAELMIPSTLKQQFKIDQFIKIPTEEVLRKRFIVSREEPITFKDLTVFLLAIVMGLETQGQAQKDSFVVFLKELFKVLEKCPVETSQDSLDLVKELLVHSNWRIILEQKKYMIIVGPNRPLRQATDASNLIKAGACINGTCM
jgi:hypothetical protein